MPEARRRLRASDAERDAVVADLRNAGATGRLSVSEMTERIGRALESRTLGELDELTIDLPRASDPRLSTAPSPLSARRTLRLWRRATELVILNAACLALWASTPNAHGGFWPAWVLLFSALWFARTAVRQVERARRRARRGFGRGAPPLRP